MTAPQHGMQGGQPYPQHQQSTPAGPHWHQAPQGGHQPPTPGGYPVPPGHPGAPSPGGYPPPGGHQGGPGHHQGYGGQAGAFTAAGGPSARNPAEAAARAAQRTGLGTLVKVEFRKLTGTRSDRILLVLGPLVLLWLTVGFTISYNDTRSAADQITPLTWGTRFTCVVVHAAVIKLVAGEWQHRSAQPTLLVQPSRGRYFLAQSIVVLLLWLVCAVLQITAFLVTSPIAVPGHGNGYLLDQRYGWVIGVGLLGSLLTISVALVVAMLLPNAAGALAVYCVVVPALMIFIGLTPEVVVWLDPLTPAMSLATLSSVPGPGPVVVSLVLWLGLLVLAGFRVARRDVS